METLVEASSSSKVSKGPRACATCARAKSRCIPGPDGQQKCERCHRLCKPCSQQTPAPPRKRKDPKPTRVSELERRIEDLTALIGSSQNLAVAAAAAASIKVPIRDLSVVHPPPLHPEGMGQHPGSFPGAYMTAPSLTQKVYPIRQGPWDDPAPHLFPREEVSFVSPEEQPSQQPQDPLRSVRGGSLGGMQTESPSSRSSPHTQHQDDEWPGEEEAEQLLADYRTHMCHLFPFVRVPRHLTSAQIREQRPFLWKAVMMEACHQDGPRQMVLGNRLLEDISEAAFMPVKATLDMLQGTQLLVAWFNYNLVKSQTTNLLFLIRSITSSLNYDDLEGEDGWSSESLEKMRAFAGTYYMVTVAFTTNKNPDYMVESPCLSKCCQILRSRREYETDELLVYLVRTQQATQYVARSLKQHNTHQKEIQPLAALIEKLRRGLHTFKSTLPPDIKENPAIKGHIQVAELLLYQSSFHEPETSHWSSQESPVVPMSPTEERLQMLWDCARVVREFLAARFEYKMTDYPRFVCMSSFPFTFVFLTLLKLMTLRLPGWDLKTVREELGFEQFVERQIEDMEFTAARRKKRSRSRVSGGASNQNSPEDPDGPRSINGYQEIDEDDPFVKLARKIRNLKTCVVGCLSEFEKRDRDIESGVATTGLTRVYEQAPMTLADATQDLMHDLIQDLGGNVWQSSDWNFVELYLNAGDPMMLDFSGGGDGMGQATQQFQSWGYNNAYRPES
ncbi:protein priB [Podospora australis]|uniref:Protein priB n=1 Tax=Podospora australis TaxID=1536484 RepID=A0AAN7AHD1_9PEZI|nr:protein priB [Podospora australis]